VGGWGGAERARPYPVTAARTWTGCRTPGLADIRVEKDEKGVLRPSRDRRWWKREEEAVVWLDPSVFGDPALSERLFLLLPASIFSPARNLWIALPPFSLDALSQNWRRPLTPVCLELPICRPANSPVSTYSRLRDPSAPRSAVVSFPQFHGLFWLSETIQIYILRLTLACLSKTSKLRPAPLAYGVRIHDSAEFTLILVLWILATLIPNPGLKLGFQRATPTSRSLIGRLPPSRGQLTSRPDLFYSFKSYMAPSPSRQHSISFEIPTRKPDITTIDDLRSLFRHFHSFRLSPGKPEMTAVHC
jgi:hypothetical protein